MTPEDYVSKLTRLDELMGIDPQDSSEPEFEELRALADELETYERATWPYLYPPTLESASEGEEIWIGPDDDSQ